VSIAIKSNGATIAADLGRQSGRMTRRMIAVVREAGDDMADAWRDNAIESSGRHGKHYPKAIQSRPVSPLTVVVAPWGSGKQSDMSFEFGSRNQPPHLDGQRALDALHKAIERRIELASSVF